MKPAVDGLEALLIQVQKNYYSFCLISKILDALEEKFFKQMLFRRQNDPNIHANKIMIIHKIYDL
jgi:hypothetical protein